MKDNINYVLNMAKELHALREDEDLLIKKLCEFTQSELEELLQNITVDSKTNEPEKINKIRAEVLKHLIGSKTISKPDIENIKKKVNDKYPTNILQAWKSYFSLFYVFFYNEKKNHIEGKLSDISEKLISSLNMIEYVKSKVVGFDGTQNFGKDEAWIALYNKDQPNQSTSLQLFINLSTAGLSYGLFEHLSKDKYITRQDQSADDIDENKIISFLSQSVDNILQDKEHVNYWKFAPGEEARFWDEMYNKGIASIGWGRHDFRGKTKHAIREMLGLDVDNSSRADGIIENINKLKVGDLIFAFDGRKKIIGYGKVTSEAEYSDECLISESDHHNFVKVNWQKIEGGKNLKKMVAIDALSNITSRKLELNIEILDNPLVNNSNHDGINELVIPLNQILYGPPGTGKTFYTVKKAVEICDSEFQGDYKGRYKELQEEGRIEFVTFHQSYGYEEFIEGIRAETIENSDGTSSISYDVQPGVFKRISQLAGKNSGSKESGIKEFTDVFKDAVIDKVSKDEKLEITMTRSRYFINEVTERTIFFDKDKGESKHSLSIKTLQKIYDTGSNQIIVGGLQPYYEALLQYLHEYSQVKVQVEKKNYVLIIDEINRGNMSKIFGELITLIEEDKRLGAEHEMTVRLPVSGDEFGVPSNLHIIGTMNTADRSIAMMDTALRRRFAFEEMMPNPCLLHTELLPDDDPDWEDFSRWDMSNKDAEWQWGKDWESDLKVRGVNLRRLLHAINQRIEVLYDREHTIGHAFFMGLTSKSNLLDLAAVFQNKVIPLLAEYFFEDWEKIRLVLGDNQKEQKEHQFIVEKADVSYQALFGDESSDYSDERKVYERNSEALDHAESYIGIYENQKKETKTDS